MCDLRFTSDGANMEEYTSSYVAALFVFPQSQLLILLRTTLTGLNTEPIVVPIAALVLDIPSGLGV